MDIPPPPLVIQDSDPSLVDRACKRLTPKSSLSRLLSLPNFSFNLRSSPSFPSLDYIQVPNLPDNTPINLDSSALVDEEFLKDRYEWAVLYENQRGRVLS